MSRQNDWQKAQAAKGLCRICGQPSVNKSHCEKHAEYCRRKERERYRKRREDAGYTVNPTVKDDRLED